MNRNIIVLTGLIGLALAACVGRGSTNPATAPAAVKTTPEDSPVEQPAAVPSPTNLNTSEVSIETDKDVYREGETVVVLIENNLVSPIQFTELCGLHYCQQSGTDWICEERECDGPDTVLEAGDELAVILEASSFVTAGQRSDTNARYKLDYQIISEQPFYFAHSNEFTILGTGLDCSQARQRALEHAQQSAYWGTIDAGRVAVRWQDEDRACVVDFAWQGAGEIAPALWSEGYAVVVSARSSRVREAYAYER